MLHLAITIAMTMADPGKPVSGLPATTVTTETATLGRTRAEITIDPRVSLRIWRDGRLLVDGPIAILHTKSYNGPTAMDVRGDGHGDAYVRIGIDGSTPAIWKKYPDQLILYYRYDPALHRYVASLEPTRSREPYWSSTLQVRHVTRAAHILVSTNAALKAGRFALAGTTIEIVRRGVRVPAPSIDGDTYDVRAPTIIDLDGDGEPEIDFESDLAGTNCCAANTIYRFDASSRRYVKTSIGWGFYRDAPSLRHLDGDGHVEFVSHDEGLTSRFAPGCCSGPGVLRIGRFVHDRMEWVTRRYPSMIRSDAWHAWQAVTYKGFTQKVLQRPQIAWYMADKYMLGEEREGWTYARSAYQGSDWPAFERQVRSALVQQRAVPHPRFWT